jgi:hypothetical protein
MEKTRKPVATRSLPILKNFKTRPTTARRFRVRGHHDCPGGRSGADPVQVPSIDLLLREVQ